MIDNVTNILYFDHILIAVYAKATDLIKLPYMFNFSFSKADTLLNNSRYCTCFSYLYFVIYLERTTVTILSKTSKLSISLASSATDFYNIPI